MGPHGLTCTVASGNKTFHAKPGLTCSWVPREASRVLASDFTMEESQFCGSQVSFMRPVQIQGVRLRLGHLVRIAEERVGQEILLQASLRKTTYNKCHGTFAWKLLHG
jgi:hypothetical protein